jgi:hypothetical protein
VRSAESPVTPSHTMREILLQGNTASVGPSREDPTISPSTWTYHESQDDMGRGTIKTARMESVNRITFGFPYEGIQRARLTLRQHPAYGKDVMLSIDRGQFLCQIGGCQVLVRFDEAKPQPHSAVAPEDHRTTMLFIQGYETIVTKIARAKTLRIEAQFYQEGPRVFEFQVAGLTWAASAKQTTKRPK